MGALAHFLEEKGLPTTQISLIQVHTEKTKPPRALWVPFALGRPFGVPNDPAFQSRVLLAALKLLEEPTGPLIEDFPEDAPFMESEPSAPACALPLSGSLSDMSDDVLSRTLIREIDDLAECHQEALNRTHQTSMGASGLAPEEIGAFLADFLTGVELVSPQPDLTLPWFIKLATEDLKAYYIESATARSDHDPGHGYLDDWFWEQTAAGQAFRAISRRLANSSDDEAKLVGMFLIIPKHREVREA